MRPQSSSVVRRPGTVVVRKLRHVFRLGEATEEEMVQHGIVQHHHTRFAERQFVDAAMKLVIADVIQPGGRALVVDGNGAAAIAWRGARPRSSRPRRWARAAAGRRIRRSRFWAASEQCRADAYDGRAFLNANFEVMRHAHG